MNKQVFEMDLVYELMPVRMQIENIMKTHDISENQLCFTHTADCTQDHLYQGCGSLKYDIDLSLGKKEKKNSFDEKDFVVFNSAYVDTPLHSLYLHLNKLYTLGRFRLMITRPKQCYSWHRDENPRLHVPLVTNPHAYMVFDNTTYHLQSGKLYLTDTTQPHTAFNSGLAVRYHLVGVVL